MVEKWRESSDSSRRTRPDIEGGEGQSEHSIQLTFSCAVAFTPAQTFRCKRAYHLWACSKVSNSMTVGWGRREIEGMRMKTKNEERGQSEKGDGR